MLSSQTKRRLGYAARVVAFTSFLVGAIPVLSTSVLGIHSVPDLSDFTIGFATLLIVAGLAALVAGPSDTDKGAKKERAERQQWSCAIAAVVGGVGLLCCFFAGTYIHTANPALLPQTITSQLAIATGAAPGPLTFEEVLAGDVVIATGAAVLILLFGALAYNLHDQRRVEYEKVV